MASYVEVTENDFIVPTRGILNQVDFANFHKSPVLTEILNFVKDCADAVVDSKISDECDAPHVLVEFKILMNRLYELVSEIPPIKQPMRFGNKAFRDWHTRMLVEAEIFLNNVLPTEKKTAVIELVPYFSEMFGNCTRIDYGTGHELNFAILFLAFLKIGLITKKDFKSVLLIGFSSYIQTMRRLQNDYMLEPAGSHGVWGLDDYHCLLFLWGSAQLSKQNLEKGETHITPMGIHDKNILKEYSSEYFYLEGISFIRKIKSSAPFSETSPMLNDISAINEWPRICTGLMRLFQGEVLGKFPVVQHLLFGSIIKKTW